MHVKTTKASELQYRTVKNRIQDMKEKENKKKEQFKLREEERRIKEATE